MPGPGGVGFFQRHAASGFTDPSSVSGLVAWWKADSLALTDGTAVSSWSDSSGHSHTLAQATGSLQPIYKTGIIGGKPIVRFDSVDDYMDVGGTISTLTTNVTLFAVVSVASVSAHGMFVHNGSSSNGWGFGYGSSGSGDTNGNTYVGLKEAVAWVDGSQTFSAATAVVVAAQIQSDSKFKFWKAGGTGGLSANTSSVITPTTDCYVGGMPSPQRAFGGDIGDVIVYDASLSTTDRDNVGSWLASKYSLTWTTPSS